MIIDYNHIRPQIDELLTVYTGLEETTDYNNFIILSGIVSINRIYNNFLVDKEYKTKIFISLNDMKMPEVFDIGNHIDNSYIHKYKDGKLCLETDAYVAFCFYKEYSLLQWMQNIVEPYYYAYEYYTRFNKFPFGERKHNLSGVIETYQQIFEEQDPVKVYKLLRAISQKKYRGHLPCPCDSGTITRKCHGTYILPFIRDMQLYHIAHNDYKSICEEINKYNDKQ